MEPIKIPGANLVLMAPKGMSDCVDLHARTMPDGGVTSAWQMSSADIDRLLINGGVVHVRVLSDVEHHPPISVFVPEQPDNENLIYTPQPTMTLLQKFDKAVSLARDLNRRIALQLPDCAYIIDGSKDAADAMREYSETPRNPTCT